MQGAKSSDHEPAARTVGLAELKANADEIVREVRDTGRPIDITDDGETVARLTPSPLTESEPIPRRWTDEERATFWREIEVLAQEISRTWPKGVSAEDAINDVRREL